MRLALEANRPRNALTVELPEGPIAVPPRCANCCEPGGEFQRESSRSAMLLIPYCGRCAQRVAQGGTDQLAATLASILAVVTVLLSLPRLLPSITLPSFLVWVAAAAAVPMLSLRWLRRTKLPESAASSRAVFFDRRGRLVCFQHAWAEQLAEDIGSELHAELHREPRVNGWMWLVCALGLAVAPSVYSFNYPDLVVLNFGETEVMLEVDGKLIARIEPTSLESEDAGTRLRIAAGEHEVRALSADGQTVERFSARVRGGALHVMTVSGDDYCFWLERDTYGRGGPEPRQYDNLESQTPLWVVPARVDSWFSNNPSPSADGRSSGGTMTALRHARCQDAPPQVQ